MANMTFTDWVERRWWVFPLATAALGVGALAAFHAPAGWWLLLCGLAVVSLLLQLVALVTLLKRRRWWRAVGALLAGVASLVPLAVSPLLLVVALFADSVVPDDFGKSHPIPEGLEFSIPITDTNRRWNATDGYLFTPVEVDSADTASWLQIWNGDQGGIYHFALYWPALEDGEVYLRCFEATENIELSKDRMRPRTLTPVSGHDAFGQVVEPNHKDFTIYEGDWGEYYAVRVEVWHKPKHGRPHKLMEKVYRMEGWMR